jgi:DNA gyrase/topoisomerase IV subunit B
MRFIRGDREGTPGHGKSDRRDAVVFKPDAKIFSTTEIDFEIVSKRLREMAYLMGTRGIVIALEDERTGAKERYEFPQGLRDFVQHINKNKPVLHADVVHLSKTVPSPDRPDREYEVELALQYTDTYRDVYTFVNNIHTPEARPRASRPPDAVSNNRQVREARQGDDICRAGTT